MIATWLYTIRAGQSVRVPIDLNAGRRLTLWAVDWSLAEPYYEPPLRAQMPTAEQRRIESMVSRRMRNTDNCKEPRAQAKRFW